MRQFLVVMALIIGFCIVSGRFSGRPSTSPDSDAAFTLLRVVAAGTLTGLTLTIGDYVVEGMLNKGEAEQFARERRLYSEVDWIGRMVGFSLLAWFVWKRFGRRAEPQN